MSEEAEVTPRSEITKAQPASKEVVPIIYPRLVNLASLPTVALSLNVPLLPILPFAISIEEILKHLQDYIKDPSQLIEGPKSTGTREETVKSWKEHCETQGHTLAQDCPLVCSEWKCHYWDRVGSGANILGTLTLSWQSDCCNIYNVDVQYTVQNPKPNDYGVLVKKDYSIPETDPVELGICKPCTKKCLRAKLTIVTYGIPLGGVPGQKHQMALNLKLCPSGAAGFRDDTNYRENEGDGNGSVANPKHGETVSVPKPNEDDTWGVRPAAGPNPIDVNC